MGTGEWWMEGVAERREARVVVGRGTMERRAVDDGEGDDGCRIDGDGDVEERRRRR